MRLDSDLFEVGAVVVSNVDVFSHPADARHGVEV